jgi:hypothetical protein
MKSCLGFVAVLLGIAASLPLAACIAVAAGAAAGYGTHQYVTNEVTRDYPADLTRTWQATLAAMREQGYPVAEGVPHGPNEGRLEINDAKVVVERTGPTSSRVRARIGTFETDGHRQRATSILDAVSRRLR